MTQLTIVIQNFNLQCKSDLKFLIFQENLSNAFYHENIAHQYQIVVVPIYVVHWGIIWNFCPIWNTGRGRLMQGRRFVQILPKIGKKWPNFKPIFPLPLAKHCEDAVNSSKRICTSIKFSRLAFLYKAHFWQKRVTGLLTFCLVGC